ncbi:MAG TPA: hypothetical protein VK645_01165 [Chitinophagaceae bacterium]|nr:hypothetical protein [Chitinophagaceae bacterium]
MKQLITAVFTILITATTIAATSPPPDKSKMKVWVCKTAFGIAVKDGSEACYGVPDQ